MIIAESGNNTGQILAILAGHFTITFAGKTTDKLGHSTKMLMLVLMYIQQLLLKTYQFRLLHIGASRRGPSHIRNIPLHSSFAEWYPAPPPRDFTESTGVTSLVAILFTCSPRSFISLVLSTEIGNFGDKLNFKTEIQTLNRDIWGNTIPVLLGEWNWSYGR